MRRVIVLTGAISGTLFALVAGAAEMTEPPEGPNRDLFAKACQSWSRAWQ
jgi:hypothetical protein